MISSWFSFDKLCKVINNRLQGMVFSECYSFNKNELIIHNAVDNSSSIIINLTQPLPHLFIQTVNKPSRKVPIFPGFKNLTLHSCEMAPADRDMRFLFLNGAALIIRIRPPVNNVFFISGDNIGSFKKVKSNLPDFHFEKSFFTSLEEDPRFNLSWKKRIKILFPGRTYMDIIYEINNSNGCITGGKFVFLPVKDEFFDPDIFYSRYREFIISNLNEMDFKPEKTRLISLLSTHSDRLLRSIRHLSSTEEQKEMIVKNRYCGDILMAGLRSIEPGQTEYDVPDSLQKENFPRKIPLKPDVSPQANAKNYYDKARRAERAQSDYEEKRINLEKDYLLSSVKFHEFEQIEDIGTLLEWKKSNKAFTENLKKQVPEKQSEQERKPYREFTYKSWHIWVGKSAKDNDDMTFHHAHKNDLWLHVRHSTGSHVIVRREGKPNIPNEIIEYAASLAARYSEEKHASLVSVVCTEKKHVIKKKGLPPGKVLFSLEKSILIKPMDIE